MRSLNLMETSINETTPVSSLDVTELRRKSDWGDAKCVDNPHWIWSIQCYWISCGSPIDFIQEQQPRPITLDCHRHAIRRIWVTLEHKWHSLKIEATPKNIRLAKPNMAIEFQDEPKTMPTLSNNHGNCQLPTFTPPTGYKTTQLWSNRSPHKCSNH